jgi:predicted LPLAT superfamily acyltransferase
VIGDLLRWGFWAGGRRLPWTPERVGHAARLIAGSRSRAATNVAVEELRLTFPNASPDTVRRADLLWSRCMLEELLLGRLDEPALQQWVERPTPGTLSNGRGTVLLFPHAGNVMLLLAAVAYSHPNVVQVAARGFHPDHQPGALARAARRARESSEDRLPCSFHTPDQSPRGLYRILNQGGVVCVTMDGRAGAGFVETRFLGRRARLSSGPYKLAAKTGANLLPALAVTDGGPWQIQTGMPLTGDDPDRLREGALAQLEPWLTSRPDHYLRWIVHCRLAAIRAGNPLFP